MPRHGIGRRSYDTRRVRRVICHMRIRAVVGILLPERVAVMNLEDNVWFRRATAVMAGMMIGCGIFGLAILLAWLARAFWRVLGL